MILREGNGREFYQEFAGKRLVPGALAGSFFAGNRVGVEGTGSGPDYFLLGGRVRISW